MRIRACKYKKCWRAAKIYSFTDVMYCFVDSLVANRLLPMLSSIVLHALEDRNTYVFVFYNMQATQRR